MLGISLSHASISWLVSNVFTLALINKLWAGENRIIAHVNTPTYWISNMMTVLKADKKQFWLCLDPHDLNEIIMSCPPRTMSLLHWWVSLMPKMDFYKWNWSEESIASSSHNRLGFKCRYRTEGLENLKTLKCEDLVWGTAATICGAIFIKCSFVQSRCCTLSHIAVYSMC